MSKPKDAKRFTKTLMYRAQAYWRHLARQVAPDMIDRLPTVDEIHARLLAEKQARLDRSPQ